MNDEKKNGHHFLRAFTLIAALLICGNSHLALGGGWRWQNPLLKGGTLHGDSGSLGSNVLPVGNLGTIPYLPSLAVNLEVYLPHISKNFNPNAVQLPRTGQTTCYDTAGAVISCAGTGQDGEIQAGVIWPDPRFAVSGDCVTDKLTGVMWSKNGNPAGSLIWQGALDYVASINSGAGLCGYHDWRLPNVNELESLVNAGMQDSAAWLNTQGFYNVTGTHWSSTSFTFHPYNAWIVAVDGVLFNYWNKTSSYSGTWPVRGATTPPACLWKTGQTACYNTVGTIIPCAGTGQDGEIQAGVTWPDPRFTVSGECVTDQLTGLMWSKNGNLPDGHLNWQGALNYIAAINSGAGLCGYHDWRLPNRRELRSLIDFSQYSPALPLNHPFNNVQSPYYYWSSTTGPLSYTNSAWIVESLEGGMIGLGKNNPAPVWPVRTKQGGP